MEEEVRDNPHRGKNDLGDLVYSTAAFCYCLSMPYFPVFLDMQGGKCLVVGAGNVGMRKLDSLLESQPTAVVVVDKAPPDPRMQQLIQGHRITYFQRTFQAEDLEGCFLVFACTSEPEVNKTIASLCRDKHILCNVADSPEQGTFSVPSHFREGHLTVAVSTSGLSPALAKTIRMDLQKLVSSRYTQLVEFMGRLRPLVMRLDWTTQRNTALFQAVLDSPLPDALHAKDKNLAHAALMQVLPTTLHPHIGTLLHEFF